MIQVQNIHKKYGEFSALAGVNFTIEPGKITALLGPNGAGKTTLMKILTGFLEATQGTVEIEEEFLTENNKEKLQQRIGYLPENAPLYPELNVWEHLDFMAKIHGLPKSERSKQIQKTAKLCGLSEKLFFEVSELSKGYKQRIGLAQAIIHNPAILILDEPTTGLDPNQILEIRELISAWRKTKTILLSTHIMQEVEAVADNVIMLKEGRVIEAGTKAEISLQGTGGEFNFKVEIRGNKNDLQKAKRTLQTLVAITKIEIQEGALRIQATEDCRTVLVQEIAKLKLDLQGLSLQQISLEDIFRNLTKK